MKKIEPLGNKVLIETVKIKETPGGILVPDNVHERFLKGEVLAVGTGEVCGTHDNKIVLKKVAVQPGDVVLYDSVAVIDVGNDQFLIAEHDLQCRFVEAKTADAN